MIQSGYTAAQGIKAQQQRVDALANNIANINTTGYKATKIDFKDALYVALQDPSEPEGTDNLQRGSGVLISGMSKVFKQGAYLETGRETDLYLDGEGFFAVQTPEGETYYTRDGSFSKSIENGATYLVNAKGYYVLDVNGQRIALQGDTMEVSPEGQISAGENTQPYATLQIAVFPNQKGLTQISDNMFAVSEASGNPARAGGTTKVLQEALEGSNVELASELTKLMRAQRAFSLSSRALTTADEMDGAANTMR
jgi:flagellar basal-body rod protein FlgG